MCKTWKEIKKMCEVWKVFFNKNTGEVYGIYTIEGTFACEEETTKALLARERGISPDDIGTRIKINGVADYLIEVNRLMAKGAKSSTR